MTFVVVMGTVFFSYTVIGLDGPNDDTFYCVTEEIRDNSKTFSGAQSHPVNTCLFNE